MNKGTLFILSGPSGVGKNAIEKRLRKLSPEIQDITTYTTRSPRPGEKQGVAYHFTTKEAFQTLIDQGHFFEWVEFDKNFYGTSKESLEKALASDKQTLLVVDVRGALDIKKAYPETTLIFLKPEKLDYLKAHLQKRKKSEADMQWRLDNAKKELEMAHLYDFEVINEEGKMRETAQKVLTIMEKPSILDK